MEKYTVNLFYINADENRQILNVTGYSFEGIDMVKFETETGCEIFRTDRLQGFNMIKAE